MVCITSQPRLTTYANRTFAVDAKGRRRCAHVCASVHARWCLDVRYGCKQDATVMLQEWVGTVGKVAGLTQQNTRLFSGCLGVPESRLEMEVTFDSMAQWESFLAAIPMDEHRVWTQSMKDLVVDGSPVWHVHRSVALESHVDWYARRQERRRHAEGQVDLISWPFSTHQNQKDYEYPDNIFEEAGHQQFEEAQDEDSREASEKQLAITDQIGAEDMATWNRFKNQAPKQQQQQQQPPGGAVPAAPSSPAASEAADDKVPRDWKGEPMKINPGDKLPFKFL